MTIYTLGSINADHFYRLPHLPQPGETLACSDYSTGLGGKGANQSVAAARAGASVVHIGAIGPEGAWMCERLAQFGVDCTHVATLDVPSGHAIINVDAGGENSIVIFAGANRAVTMAQVEVALAQAEAGDVLLLQNETNLTVETARFAQEQGLKVVYSAAPFDAAAVQRILPFVSLLLVNEGEAAQLRGALGLPEGRVPVADMVTTRGAKDALWQSRAGAEFAVPAWKVEVRDTTGAGDTFAGYLAAGLSEGMEPKAAMRMASAAAALKVTRAGTADAIPARAEVDDLLKAQ
ncbi:MAG: ribokinase [Paracoccaceae bacterium]